MLLLLITMLLAPNSQAHDTQACLIPVSTEFIWPASCAGVQKEPIPGIPERVLNWGSGGLGGTPWRFSESTCNDFLLKLTQAIGFYNSQIRLTPHDLFHAHMINYEAQATALVFHAKEYPYDLERVKNYYQTYSHMFYSFENSYQDRNFVYFSQDTEFAMKNILYLVNDSGFCHRWFDPISVNTLSEERLARDLKQGRRAGDVNMFFPESLKNIAYNFGAQEEVLTGKSEQWRRDSNEVFYQWLSTMHKPLVYMLTGH